MATAPGPFAVPVRFDHVDLAVVGLEVQHGGAVGVGEGVDRGTGTLSYLLDDSRGDDRALQVVADEGDHLAAHLQVGHM